MVYRGRSVTTTGYSVRNRASSVPGFQIDDGIGISFEPSISSHRVFTASAPRTRHEHLDLSSARQPDSKFYNDVNARLAALGPEPILMSPYHAASYTSAAPVLTNISSYGHHHHSHHHVPEVVVRRRTATTTAAPVVHRRGDFDAEVAAYLSYTPQHHHHYSHRTSSLRSSSVPPVSLSSFSPPPPPPSFLSSLPSTSPSSYAPFHAPILKHYNSQSRFSHAVPSYISQFQHKPLDTPLVSGLDYAPRSHLSLHSTHAQPALEESFHSPGHRTVSVRASYHGTPSSSLHYDYEAAPQHDLHGVHDVQISTERHPMFSDPVQRSRSRFSRSSALSSYCPPSDPSLMSLSGQPSKPLSNFKEVKPPISETRRKVRDLICKTRKDPTYYK